jgi:hypothetical protein
MRKNDKGISVILMCDSLHSNKLPSKYNKIEKGKRHKCLVDAF